MIEDLDLKEKARKNPFAWAFLNREISKGVPYSNENYWFQKAILEDKSRMVVVKKSAQLGMSDTIIMFSFWFLENRKENVLYCMPTDTAAKTFSKINVDSVVNQFPHFGEKVKDAKNELTRASKKNSVNIKQVGDASMIILGMNGERGNLESFPAGMVVVDEYAKVKDAETVAVAEKRLKASKNKLKRYFSTPLYPMDMIDRLYMKGTQMKWHITCDHCGMLQNPNFFTHHNKLNKNEEVRNKECHYVCEVCNKKLNPLKQGQFIAMNPEGKFNSYHINTVFVPHAIYNEDTDKDDITDSSSDIWDKYQEALEDGTKMAEFHRQELGEGYLSSSDGISDGDIYECQSIGSKIYSEEFSPVKGRKYVIGADIGTFIHIVTLEVDPETNIGAIVNIRKYDGLDKFDKLDEFIEYVEPVYGVIDKFPETNESTRICQNNEEYSIKMAQHNSGLGTPCLYKEDGTNTVLYNRTLSFDAAFQKIKNRRRKIPQDVDREFKEHFTNVIRVKVKDKNLYTYTGKNGGKMPDHYLSAFVFAEMGVSLIQRSEKEVDGAIIKV